MSDTKLRKVEGYSPGACGACDRETEDLNRVRSVHYHDPEYVTESEGHRAWFHWFCRLCYATYASTAHKYGYEHKTLYAHVSQVGWFIFDNLRPEAGGEEGERRADDPHTEHLG